MRHSYFVHILSFLCKKIMLVHIVSKQIIGPKNINKCETLACCIDTYYGMPLYYNNPKLFIFVNLFSLLQKQKFILVYVVLK